MTLILHFKTKKERKKRVEGTEEKNE